MNMLKRIASVAVALVMMLQIAVFAAPVPEDVIGTEYESAASLLCALNIMVGDGTNFNPDDDITRAEFAQIMMKSLALDSAAESYQPRGMFNDVPTSNIFAPAIELGAGIGAIKGYGDGNFGPDDNVLGTEAVKMMTFAAGHDVIAENNGGYPNGYLARAREIGMLKGITNLDFNVPMTRGQAAILCANTLKVDMMKKVTVGGEIRYEFQDDVNLLSEKHDVYKATGLVSANSTTSLWQTSVLPEGKVQIENGTARGVFSVGETTIADAVGKNVDAYYLVDEDADTQVVVAYDISESKNSVVTVDIENIDYTTIANTSIEYWADKENDIDTTELDIVTAPSIIFNGMARAAGKTVVDTFNEIEGKPGEVTFIDNNGDGNVDILNVTAYDTVYVSKVNPKDYKISDKLTGKTWTVDVYASNMNATVVDIDGEPLEFEDISEGDVLSIAMSDSGLASQSVKIIDSQESVDGEVTSISLKDGKYIFSIDDEKYELAPEYHDYIALDASGNLKPVSELKVKIGSIGEFYLDAFENIAYDELEGVSGDATFGFLRAAAPGKGADTSLKFKIFVDGEYVEYTAAGKVSIDGTVHKGEAAIAAALQASLDYINASISYYTGLSDVSPLLFNVDADDKINMIDTPYKGAEESEYSLQSVRNTDWTKPESYTFNRNLNSLGSMVRLESSAFAIQLPPDVSQIDNTNKITISKASSWANEKKIENVQAFTTEPDSNKAMFIVSKLSTTAANLGDTSSEHHDKQIFVVSEVVECLDDEGRRTIMVKGLQEAAQKEFMVDAEYYATDLYGDVWDVDGWFATYAGEMVETDLRRSSILLPGDAIRYRTDESGAAIYITPTYLIDAKVFRADDQGGTQDTTRYRAFDLAVVSELDENDMYLKYLINKKTGNHSEIAKVEVNKDGYVVSSKNSAKLNLTLFDEATKTYTADMTPDELQTATAFKIMVYDASKPNGQKVYVGSTFDLYDASDAGTPASLVIMQFRSSNPRGMYIIKY